MTHRNRVHGMVGLLRQPDRTRIPSNKEGREVSKTAGAISRSPDGTRKRCFGRSCTRRAGAIGRCGGSCTWTKDVGGSLSSGLSLCYIWCAMERATISNEQVSSSSPFAGSPDLCNFAGETRSRESLPGGGREAPAATALQSDKTEPSRAAFSRRRGAPFGVPQGARHRCGRVVR
jgi:hypothetical protein